MYLHTTDAHCHADFSKYADFSGLAFGVDLCVDACFPGDWEGLQKFDAFPVKKAYGIHPDLRVSEFDDMSFVESELFSTFLPSLDPYLISADAIGETGLDSRLDNRLPAALPRRLFAEQLRLAGKYGLPAVIHCVGMYGAVFEILKAWTAEYSPTMEERLEGKKERRFLLHAASCSPEMAREFEKIGARFSFGLRELSSERGRRCAAAVSPDRRMVESDYATSRNTYIVLREVAKSDSNVSLSSNNAATHLHPSSDDSTRRPHARRAPIFSTSRALSCAHAAA